MLILSKYDHSHLFFFGFYSLRFTLGVFKRKFYNFYSTTPKSKCVSREKCLSYPPSQHLQAGPSMVQESHLCWEACLDLSNPFSKLLFFLSSNTFVISIIKILGVGRVLPVQKASSPCLPYLLPESTTLCHQLYDVQEMPTAEPTGLCPSTGALQ